MLIVLGADPHGSGRTDEELDLSIKVFEDAYEIAEREGAEYVFWLGDMLHFKYGLELRLLLEEAEIVREYRRRGIKTRMLPGNHDKPFAKERDKVAIKLIGDEEEIVCKPRVEIVEGTMYAYLPWFPPDEFKQYSNQLAEQASRHPGLKFLFSHVSLAEGFVSPSNYQVEQQIRMGDLHPDVWDKVFLGDYHSHQNVGTKIVYLGAPRPTTFGDAGNRGFWLLDVRNNGTWYFTNVGLVSKFPEYHQLTIGPGDDPIIPDWDPYNKYIVTCSSSHLGELNTRYPGAILKTLPGTFTIPKQARFSDVVTSNPVLTFRSWMELKGLDPSVYGPIGEEAIMESLGQVR